ncbi:MAG: TonB-dependent receptor, partial [Bacteroidaceae bacterium]|nr:TonB-dependent receptor [Bacteroidaceae bacterium]
MRRWLAIVAALVASLLPLYAAAGDRDSVRWEEQMEQMVVTATRTPRLLKDVPVLTRVLTAEDIRLADANGVAELLQQELPGLEFSWAMSREVSLNMNG